MVVEEQFERVFDSDEGWLCLDFANTVEWHARPHDREEYLTHYRLLVQWAQQAEILTTAGARRLLEEAKRHPESADEVLFSAIDLREAIYGIFSALAADHVPATEDIEVLNDVLAAALPRLQLTPTDEGFVWFWEGNACALDGMLGPIAWSAAQLLTSDELDRVGECATEGCGWLFMDRSRNRSRQWCDMGSCGNRAKARRYYQRRRNARSPRP